MLVAWLTLALECGYAPVVARAERLLSEVGRMKYLRPIYRAMLDRPEFRPTALRVFENSASGYHPIARALVQSMVDSGR